MATITACDPCGKKDITTIATMKVPAVLFSGSELRADSITANDFAIELVDACADHAKKILNNYHAVAMTVLPESGFEEALGLRPQPTEDDQDDQEGTDEPEDDDGSEEGSQEDGENAEDGDQSETPVPDVDDLPGIDDDDQEDGQSLAELNKARQKKNGTKTAGKAAGSRVKSTSGYAAKYTDEQKNVIRAWARKGNRKFDGKAVSERGRMANAVYHAFEAAGSPGL